MYYEGEFYFNECESSEPEQRVDDKVAISIDEITENIQRVRLSSTTDDGPPALSILPKGRPLNRVEELRERVKELKERSAQAAEEAQKEKEKAWKYEAALKCVACEDVICNPYSLSCGHSACYACLRKYWTRVINGESFLSMISTDEEGNDEDDEPETTRRRQRFPSVVLRVKTCPHCRKSVKNRPVPDYTLRNMIETIESLPTRRLIRRDDPWHGIFPIQRDPEAVENHSDDEDAEILDPTVSLTPAEAAVVRRGFESMVRCVRSELADAQEESRRVRAILEELERAASNHDMA